MLQVGELLYGILTGDPALAAVISDKVFPLIASQEAEVPMVIYTISEQGPYSKNGRKNYNIAIDCYHQTHDSAVLLAEQVKQVLADAQEVFYFQDATPAIIDEKIIVVNQNYSFKN